MGEKQFNVLFLGERNSARSIMAEVIINREGSSRFRGFSAGTAPSGSLNADCVALLRKLNYDCNSLRSKSWSEFTGPEAPKLDFVFSVADLPPDSLQVAWNGRPMVAQWTLPDPEAILEQGAARGLRLAEIFKMLDRRIGIFVNLRFDALDRMTLQDHLSQIGASPAALAD